MRSKEVVIDSSRNERRVNSTYRDRLDLEAKKLYNVKIAELDKLGDPYAAQKKPLATLEWHNWPSCSGLSRYIHVQLPNR